MNINRGDYLLSTQEQCCASYFSWTENTCMGSTVPVAPRQIGWYPVSDDRWNVFANFIFMVRNAVYSYCRNIKQNWDINECLNDGKQPEYMNINHNDYVLPTQGQCCASFFSWTGKCM
jgi:hypothetical protein